MSKQSLQYYRCNDWFAFEGDKTFRLDYALDENSVVVDIGGYKGEFAQEIFDRYSCNIYVFEPHLLYADNIQVRFAKNPKVRVFPFALGSSDGQETFAISDDATSSFKEADMTFTAQIRSISDVLVELGLNSIDLMKINAEGAEYGMLQRLHEAGLLNVVDNYQIQFHDFVPDAEQRLKEARAMLGDTHAPTYMFPFVWENWKRVAGEADADLRRRLFAFNSAMQETIAKNAFDIDNLQVENEKLHRELDELSKVVRELTASRDTDTTQAG